MKKNPAVLYCTAFFLLCLVPSVGMLFGGTQAAEANETLSSAPAFIKAEKLNKNVLQDTTNYVADHFAFRQSAITMYSKLEALADTSSSERVILGKDGWLFYADTLDDYLGRNVLTDRETFCAARSLALTEEAVYARGGSFLFALVPNKNTLYGAEMPDAYTPFSATSNREKLSSELTKQGVTAVNLADTLSGDSDALYYKGDTHWNSRGAALAADAILRALNRPAARFSDGPFQNEPRHRGDLYAMLYPRGKWLEDDDVYGGVLDFSYASPFNSADDIAINTSASGRDGTLLLYRDSFGAALYPYLASQFGSASFSRKTDYAALNVPAGGCFVIELVERNIPKLLEKAPVFPAPERQVAVRGAADATATTHIDVLPAPEEYTAISGEIAGTIDDDSPIYVTVGEKTYEATPCAKDTKGNGFTLYIPKNMETLGIPAVIVSQNGELREIRCGGTANTIEKGK